MPQPCGYPPAADLTYEKDGGIGITIEPKAIEKDREPNERQLKSSFDELRRWHVKQVHRTTHGHHATGHLDGLSMSGMGRGDQISCRAVFYSY